MATIRAPPPDHSMPRLGAEPAGRAEGEAIGAVRAVCSDRRRPTRSGSRRCARVQSAPEPRSRRRRRAAKRQAAAMLQRARARGPERLRSVRGDPCARGSRCGAALGDGFVESGDPTARAVNARGGRAPRDSSRASFPRRQRWRALSTARVRPGRRRGRQPGAQRHAGGSNRANRPYRRTRAPPQHGGAEHAAREASGSKLSTPHTPSRFAKPRAVARAPRGTSEPRPPIECAWVPTAPLPRPARGRAPSRRQPAVPRATSPHPRARRAFRAGQGIAVAAVASHRRGCRSLKLTPTTATRRAAEGGRPRRPSALEASSSVGRGGSARSAGVVGADRALLGRRLHRGARARSAA